MSTIAIGTAYPGARRACRPVATSAIAPPARLTRRGRLVILLTLVGLAFAMLTMLGGQSAATGEAGVPVETRTVVISEGDNLWQIAATVAAPGEVREMIHQIEELNALTGVGLVEGQEIAVPVK